MRGDPTFVFIMDMAQLDAELRRRVELPLTEGKQIVTATQQVQQRPVVERFVEVIQSVARRGDAAVRIQQEVGCTTEARLVDEATILVGVLFEVPAPSNISANIQ